MTLNKNYKLISSRNVEEIHSTAHQYEHVKTGARVLYLQNDDANKVFNIAFRTPPEDSTGCPHILEHSVLNGSRNFPGKNTFTELVKGSMKTFLNAFTGSDRTMYPFASTNDKDFLNLMQVYLDAVLYPNIYTNPDILKQEGWHYELLKPEDEIIYKGVVYNEMKGAFSSPESILFRKIEQVQLPDTPYSHESGGDPEFIPQLTWERFKAFHAKHYHPSNSWIFLYGDMDIEKVLAFIDENYLQHFEKIDPKTEIALQKPFPQMVKVEEPYSISSQDSPDGKYYLSLNFTCGNVLDTSTTSALSILTSILMDSAASPLKLALQNSGLCADSFASFDDSCQQPTLAIVCKHVEENKLEVLKTYILETLRKIVKEGIDKKLVEATINSREFTWREADMNRFPKGLFYSIVSSKSWLHGGEPLSYLAFEPILTELRKGLTEPLYENLIEKFLLNNTHASQIILKPVQGLVGQRDAKTAKQLAEYKATLSSEQINALIEDNQHLQQWQSIPDSEADIAKIPFISLNDIKKEAEPLHLQEEKQGEVTLLKHDVATNGILYLNMYFNLEHLDEKELPWVSLIAELLGNIDSENMPFGELSNEIDIHTGGITSDLTLYDDSKGIKLSVPKFNISGKCIVSKTESLLNLMSEYAFRPSYADLERIKQLVMETKSRMQMVIISSGHVVATRRMLAQNSLSHKWQDSISGLKFYSFLCEVEQNLQNDPEGVIENLKMITAKLYNRNNLLVSLTATQDEIAAAWNNIQPLLNSLDQTKPTAIEQKFEPVKVNEGIYAPVNIQFCAQGGNYARLGYKYSGKMMVLSNILRNDFLMQEIRVKGGAYGIMVNFSRFGFMSFCSYRDPNLTNTFEVYNKVSEYLTNFQCSERDFEKYIIGTMAELDMPLTPSQKGSVADFYYISGLSFADKQKLRDEVLSTTIDDIRSYAGLIKDVMKLNQYAVFGVENTIKEHSDLFGGIIPAIPS